MESLTVNKILSFIINEHNEFLLLYESNKDPQFHKSFWYVITGGVESFDKSMEDAVKREILEETNLNVEKTMYLNWIFKYNSLGKKCIEYAYFSKVIKDDIILNEESINYKWCDLDTFIDLIDWFYDKSILKSVLLNALNNKLYFVKEHIEE